MNTNETAQNGLLAAPLDIAERFPADALARIREDMTAAGGAYELPAERRGQGGVT